MSYSPSYTDLFRRATFYTSGMEHLPTRATGTDGSERRGERCRSQGGKRCATQAQRRRVDDSGNDVDWRGDA